MADNESEGRENQDRPPVTEPTAAAAAAATPAADGAAETEATGDKKAGVLKTLVVIDAELSEESGSETIEREGKEPTNKPEQEVVLVAYAVVEVTADAATSVCQGQLFIKPTMATPPTAYYTSVTGITQEDLEKGTTLGEALDTLHKTLSSYMEDQTAVSMLTDGDKDINEWLVKDAGKKNVELRPYFKRTLDLRKQYKKWKPDTQDEIVLSSMLKAIGVAPAGDKSCGETEVTNITAVIKAMVEGQHVFKLEAEAKTQVIRLRGLPYQVTEAELVEFLQTADPDPQSLHICRGAGKRPTGDAFVRIPPSKLDAAVKLSGQRVGHRYAEVFGTTELEFKDAIKRSETIAEEVATLSNDSLSKRGPFNMVVKLRGMPFSASQADIEAFFIGVTISQNDIHICRRMDGRPNGDAFVQLQTPEEVDRCLSFDRKNLGSRYVEVFRSTQADMLNALGVGTNMGGGGGMPVDNQGGDTLTLRMQGLPFTARENDVYQFFSGLQIAPNGIQFRMNRDGRPSGVCYATFTNAEQFEEAKKKHRSMMGARYVELFACSAMEIPRDMGGQQGGHGGGYGGGMGYGQPQQQQGGQFPATYNEYQQQRNNHRMQWDTYHRQAKAYYDQNGYGAQYQQFYEQQQRQFEQSDHQAMEYYKQRQGMPGGGFGAPPGGDYGGGVNMVRMKGLPYSASPIEIAEFFNGFNVGVDDVNIVLNNDGRPSGDAHVCFPDNASAQSAVNRLNRERIGSRYIELFLDGQR